MNETGFSQLYVLERVEKRSFLECCITCDVTIGCSGVAYRRDECSVFNGTADASSSGDEEGEYEVMMYYATLQDQVCKMYWNVSLER